MGGDQEWLGEAGRNRIKGIRISGVLKKDAESLLHLDLNVMAAVPMHPAGRKQQRSSLGKGSAC